MCCFSNVVTSKISCDKFGGCPCTDAAKRQGRGPQVSGFAHYLKGQARVCQEKEDRPGRRAPGRGPLPGWRGAAGRCKAACRTPPWRSLPLTRRGRLRIPGARALSCLLVSIPKAVVFSKAALKKGEKRAAPHFLRRKGAASFFRALHMPARRAKYYEGCRRREKGAHLKRRGDPGRSPLFVFFYLFTPKGRISTGPRAPWRPRFA